MPQRVLDLVHLDFAPPHRQPSAGRLVLATIASIAGSLLADALIVVIAQALAPSTKGYVHFQFGDYAKLTIVGVIIACVAWPITTRITSQPRLMFFLMAIAVTLVLWLPDVYILVKGQPAIAVAFLFLMHLAIALVTYNALVRLAPIGAQRQASTHRARPVGR
jgi:bacteriorhodopsin